VRLPTTIPCVAPDQAAGGVVRQRPPCDGKQPGGEDDTAEHDVEEVLGLRQVKDADLPQAVVLRVAQDVAERAER
jgi:hypothetical protein